MRISDWSSDVCSSDLGTASLKRCFQTTLRPDDAGQKALQEPGHKSLIARLPVRRPDLLAQCLVGLCLNGLTLQQARNLAVIQKLEDRSRHALARDVTIDRKSTRLNSSH